MYTCSSLPFAVFFNFSWISLVWTSFPLCAASRVVPSSRFFYRLSSIWNLKFEFSTTDSPDLRTIFFSLSYLNECHKISCRHSYKALVKWWCQCGYEYGDHLFCRGELEPLRLNRESSPVAWYYISVGRMDQAWFRC